VSHFVKQQLKAFGVAQAIVVLKKAAGAERHPALDLRKHFQWSDLDRHLGRVLSVASAVAGAAAAPAASPMLHFRNLGIAYGTLDQQGWDNLRKEDAVAKVHGAPTVRPIRVLESKPAAAPPKLGWNLRQIGVTKLWRKGFTGKGVRVAHLDTGVDGKHPALAGVVEEFVEFDATGQRVPHSTAFDTSNHGTLTAGIIAGRRNNDRAVGVAPGCSLLSGIIIEGGDPTARLLAGLDWAVEKKVRIVNASLGFPDYSEEFLPVIKILRSNGILPVFAVGNEGPGTSRSPGNYAEAVSVGAIDRKGVVAADSGSQRFNRTADPIVPDLVTPGVDIVSTDAGGGYRKANGSSMAAPHVAGLAALLWEATPDSTVDQIEQAIFQSCTRPQSAPEDRANRGIPDAVKALALLTKPK